VEREDGGVVTVREAQGEDLEASIEIVGLLPDYFTPDVPDKLRSDWVHCRSWVAEDQGTVVGLCVVERKTPAVAEILWAAVHPARRAQGIGTQLVEAVISMLADGGVVLLEVKTQDLSAGYAPYEATNAFWQHRGFLQIDTIDPFPGWGPGNPCALYVQSLR